MSTDKNEITRLLVVGKTGVGKSSTCNTLLGRRVFKSGASTTSVTKECQMAEGEQGGRKLMIVDMPGLSDTSLTPEDDAMNILNNAKDAVLNNIDGYDAILTVIRFGRLTQEDMITIKCLKQIFGAEYLQQNGVLVMTHADQYDPKENDGQTLDQWVSTQEGFFKELVNDCGRKKVVLWDNKSEDKEIQMKQMDQLFSVVEQIENTGQKYTSDVFDKAQAIRDQLRSSGERSFMGTLGNVLGKVLIGLISVQLILTISIIRMDPRLGN